MLRLKLRMEEIKQRNAVAKTDYEAKLVKYEADLAKYKKDFAAYTAAPAEAGEERSKMVIFRTKITIVELKIRTNAMNN